ncbi:HotDog domain-containing protein [Annulohypoxylon moriforme]|nr:HotDog domain-containing protein [Annulohypoxylon moriforme]
MKASRASLRLLRRSPCLIPSASRACLPIWRRSYSSDGLSQDRFEAIKTEMLARHTPRSRDFMSPTNSALLGIALDDFIPNECRTGGMSIKEIQSDKRLPEGHHLVYFPLQKPISRLCPDGTDPFHSPGEPFVRRMWAGGSIKFNKPLRFNNIPVDCEERIEDVTVKGPEGEEKIFVTVLREYLTAGDRQPPRGAPRIKERRTLVFMRGLSKEQARENLAKAEAGRERIVKAPIEPDYSFTLTPTPQLLFYYSALSFNSHSIHLDPAYCREVEGQPNLLVHGPLTLTLMLTALKSQFNNSLHEIRKIDYRNLAPLYANEPLRVCVRRVEQAELLPKGGKVWEVWVEDKDGGLAVRGTVTTQDRYDPRVRRFKEKPKNQDDATQEASTQEDMTKEEDPTQKQNADQPL